MVDRTAVGPGTARVVPVGNVGEGPVTSEGLLVWNALWLFSNVEITSKDVRL